eukprot:1783730-Pyramimonas_sp.AAC.1
MDANVVSNLVSGLLSDARGERVYEPNPRADSMRMFHPEKNSEEQDLARALMFTQSKLAKLRNDEALVKRELEKTGKRCATQVLMRCDLNGVNSPTVGGLRTELKALKEAHARDKEELEKNFRLKLQLHETT